MVKLYELTQAYQMLLDNDELSQDELATALNKIADIISAKALNIARLVITLKEECAAIDNEIKRLSNRKKTRDNKIENLKTYLLSNMEAAGITKAKDNFINVLLQPNPPSVIISDTTQVPNSYWRIIPEQREVDKQAVLEIFKRQGTRIPGTDIISDKKHVVIR